MDIKRDNFRTERVLTSYAEPLAVFAALLGAPYPQGFIDRAYNWLLQNHGHDSIGGCSRNIVSDDMLYRTRQTREISSCIMERAMLDIAGSINLSKYGSEDMAVVVFNPAPFARTEVISAVIEIPLEWNCESFEILDEEGEKITVQFCDKVAPYYQIVQAKNDCANMFPMTRYHIRAEFKSIPGMGYRTFFVKPVRMPKLPQPKTMLTSPLAMENEYLAVTMNSNGTLTVRDKKTGNESIYTTLNEKAQTALIRDGELETSFRVTINWALPAGRTQDDKARSEYLKPYKIVNTITLRRGQPWVEVTTEVDNSVEDHYLQVSFPTEIETDKVMAQGQFDVIERAVETPDYSLYEEQPQSEHPMNSFVDMSDGQVGLALLNEGLKAYEADDDPANTVSLTLLRCFPLRIYVTREMTDYSKTDKGSQCLGKQSFRYAIMPHCGGWEEAQIWQAAERFNLSFIAGQIGPTKQGTESLSKSFLEVRPETLENSKGWVVRLFNPSCRAISASIRLNAGRTGPPATQSPVERVQNDFALPRDRGSKWNNVRIVTLEEIPKQDLTMDADGWGNFEIEGKKILTIEFLP
jgi:alpha-mannosidase